MEAVEFSAPEGDLRAVVRTLLVTDLVDSTRLVERLGDRKALEVSRRHDRVARDLLLEIGGREIDKTDGFLLLFERPVDAARYALAYHEALSRLSVELRVELKARSGIHLGEVYLRANDPGDVARGAKPVEVEGLAKATAARLMSLAGGGQTLLTAAAFDLARQAAGSETGLGLEGELQWLAHGPFVFQGLAKPVEVFEVGRVGRAPLAAPSDSAKAQRVLAAADEMVLGWRPATGQEIPARPHWRLEERLGEGGFGEIWLARHKLTGEARVFKFCYEADRLRSLRREVALFRLLKDALGDRDDIARILDWNFEEPPYFLEAEYTQGGSLADWAVEQGGIGAVPMATRLHLMAQVAEALGAAHSVGVLHKDVKPANILITQGVDGEPRARLTDFGIGRVTDASLLADRGITAEGLTGLVVEGASSEGTRLYMAPEVVEGKPATVQADLYALGVMLYQVVVGDLRRVLAPGWRREVSDELLAEDIAALVERLPERRPANGREVAERLCGLEERRAERRRERESQAEAGAARNALERAHRRRRALTLVASVALGVLAVVSYLAFQAFTARGVAEARQEQAESLIGFMLGDLREKLEPVGRLDILEGVGDRALEYFAAVPTRELSDGELLRRSQALSQIGQVRVLQESSDLDAAEGVFEESLHLAQDLVSRRPEDPQRHFGLGQGFFWLGRVAWQRGELDAADTHFQAYLAEAEWLTAKEPENLEWRLEEAYALSNLGSVQEARGELEGALARYRQVLEIKRGLVAAQPDNLEWQMSLADQHNLVGWILQGLGDLDGALHHYEADHRIELELVERDPRHAKLQDRLANSYNYLAGIKMDRGDYSGALADVSRDLAITSGLCERDPANTAWQRSLAAVRMRRGELLRLGGRLASAREETEAARKLFDHLLAQDAGIWSWRLDRARVEVALGRVLADLGDAGRAAVVVRRGCQMLEELLTDNAGSARLRTSLALGRLLEGRLLRREGDEAAAVERFGRAFEILEPVVQGASDGRLLASWAQVLLELGRLDEARAVVETLWARGFRERDLEELSRARGLPAPGLSEG